MSDTDPWPGEGVDAAPQDTAAAADPPRKRLRRAGDVGAAGAPPPTSPRAPGAASYDDERSRDSDGEEEEIEATRAQQFDTQCCACDDGGLLVACDGPCMRGIHVGVEVDDDEDPTFCSDLCNPLSLPPDLALFLTSPTHHDTFMCPNCLASTHQCFVCKKEGKADKDVFRCLVGSCGKFYHPACIDKSPKAPLICPLHACHACDKAGEPTELGKDKDLELVPCRRCPVAYHRRCLPRDLRDSLEKRYWPADFNDEGKSVHGVESSLIYCSKHALNECNECPHAKPLFSTGLVAKFLKHIAEMYPHLASSRARLAQAEGAPLHTREQPLRPDKVHPPAERKRSAAGAAPPAASAAATHAKPAATARAAAAAALSAQERLPQTTADPLEQAINSELEQCLPYVVANERRVRAVRLYNEAKNCISKAAMLRHVRKPYPYEKDAMRTIEEDRLKVWERSFAEAEQLPPAQRKQVLNSMTLQGVFSSHDNLSTVLAPYLHGERYTSYDRHFTERALLETVANRLTNWMRDGDQVVDFSCGENVFVPMVKEQCLRLGMVVTGRAYDIIVAKDNTDFVLRSWLSELPSKARLAQPDRLVIGLNPPYGKNNSLADEFTRHAATFKPRVIVLIVPPSVPVPYDYEVVYENNELCRGEVFYVPGSSHRSWNKTPPVLRVMVRRTQEYGGSRPWHSRDWA